MSDTIGDLSAVELTAAIRIRTISAREALADHLDRVTAASPVINAVVTLDAEEAQGLAMAAD